MQCPMCEEKGVDSEMTLEDEVKDYYDPSDRLGHGQLTYKIWHCNKCQYDEPYQEGDYIEALDTDEAGRVVNVKEAV